MNDFKIIMSKLKHILSHYQGEQILDQDLALALGLEPSNFASMKHRNTIPFRAILDFCRKHHINANTLLFSRPANNFIAKPKEINYYGEIQASAGGGAEIFQEKAISLTLHQLVNIFFYRASIVK